jgi:hypothetical protein
VILNQAVLFVKNSKQYHSSQTSVTSRPTSVLVADICMFIARYIVELLNVCVVMTVANIVSRYLHCAFTRNVILRLHLMKLLMVSEFRKIFGDYYNKNVYIHILRCWFRTETYTISVNIMHGVFKKLFARSNRLVVKFYYLPQIRMLNVECTRLAKWSKRYISTVSRTAFY